MFEGNAMRNGLIQKLISAIHPGIDQNAIYLEFNKIMTAEITSIQQSFIQTHDSRLTGYYDKSLEREAKIFANQEMLDIIGSSYFAYISGSFFLPTSRTPLGEKIYIGFNVNEILQRYRDDALSDVFLRQNTQMNVYLKFKYVVFKDNTGKTFLVQDIPQ